MAHSILRIDDLLCWSAKIHTKRKKPRHREMSGVFRLGLQINKHRFSR